MAKTTTEKNDGCKIAVDLETMENAYLKIDGIASTLRILCNNFIQALDEYEGGETREPWRAVLCVTSLERLADSVQFVTRLLEDFAGETDGIIKNGLKAARAGKGTGKEQA